MSDEGGVMLSDEIPKELAEKGNTLSGQRGFR